MVSEAVKECRCHLGITKDRGPFTKSQIGGDNDGGAFVETADEMEQQLSARLGKGQIAQFSEHDEVEAGKGIGEATLSATARFRFQPVDQINNIVEAATGAFADAGPCDGNGEMALAGSGSTDQHGIALGGEGVSGILCAGP